MPYVYNIPEISEENKNDRNHQIPSVAYVDFICKMLEDEISSHVNNSTNAHTELNKYSLYLNKESGVEIKDYITPATAELEEFSRISADDINTDPMHRFITDTQLESLKDKVSSLDLAVAITNLTSSLKDDYRKQFNRLLNDADALSKLKDAMYILANASDPVKGIFNSIDSKADKSAVEEHEKSNLHLTANDRKAINFILSAFMNGGFADWNATSEENGFIKNKPESLPADGGNADTIGGKSLSEISNRQFHDYLIGNIYSDKINGFDNVFGLDTNEDDLVSMINNKNSEGTYGFSRGLFYFKKPVTMVSSDKVSHGRTMIYGSGINSTFFTGDFILKDNIEFRDMSFNNSNINIKDNVTLRGIEFEDSTIILSNVSMLTMAECIFSHCKILLSGNLSCSVVTNNRFIKTNPILFIGGANVINNNIIM